MYQICAQEAGSVNDKAVGAITKQKFEFKKGIKIHIAIGQQGLHSWAANGGKFISRRINYVFKPVIVASGAAGTTDEIN